MSIEIEVPRLSQPIDSVIVITVLAIIALCAIDCYMTLEILNISKNAVELNPFMAVFTGGDPASFIIFKVLLTAACLFFMVIHRQILFLGMITVERIIYGVLSVYVALVMYQVSMVAGLFAVAVTVS